MNNTQTITAKLLRVDFVAYSRNGNGEYRGQFLTTDNDLEEIYGGIDSSWNTPMRNNDGKIVNVEFKYNKRRDKFEIVSIEEVK